jgi:cellulose synthase (UDP-forming)
MKRPHSTVVERRPFNPPLLRVVSLLSVIYLLYYLWWRVTATLNPDAPFFSWMLVLAEAFGVASFMLFSWMTADVMPTRAHRPPPAGLSVDIFIPTLNESLEILEATMIGCRKITYPHRTYVLDDARRDAVRQLADRLGCLYLVRPTSDHAKAGNINHALAQTGGEFIVMLDADMVPQPDFLDRTLGYFEDPKLAVIQMPQEFFNWDSVQHDQRAVHWHEQSLFFRVVQPGKNHSKSAFWCGSPSVARRTALEHIGGVATGTVTEDIHTSVRLHSRGWSSLFVNELLAFGIAPETVHSFLVQRLRWAQGTMQLYRSSESPLWIPGLTFQQRLSYLASFMAYFESFQKLLLLLTPVFIIAFDIFPIKVGMFDFLLRWLPYFAITIVANSLGGRGHFRYFKTEQYNILKMVAFIQSTVTLVRCKGLSFKVTPKSVDASVYRKERAALRAFFAILGFIGGAILYALLRIRAWDGVTMDQQLYLIAVGWASYNAAVILIAISEVLSKPHDRKEYRFHIDVDGDLFAEDTSVPVIPVRIRDLSASGVGFVADQAIPAECGKLTLHLETPAHAHVLISLSAIRQRQPEPDGPWHVGASTLAMGTDSRSRLFEYLFIEVPGMRRGRMKRRPAASSRMPGTHPTPGTQPALATSVVEGVRSW